MSAAQRCVLIIDAERCPETLTQVRRIVLLSNSPIQLPTMLLLPPILILLEVSRSTLRSADPEPMLMAEIMPNGVECVEVAAATTAEAATRKTAVEVATFPAGEEAT